MYVCYSMPLIDKLVLYCVLLNSKTERDCGFIKFDAKIDSLPQIGVTKT